MLHCEVLKESIWISFDVSTNLLNRVVKMFYAPLFHSCKSDWVDSLNNQEQSRLSFAKSSQQPTGYIQSSNFYNDLKTPTSTRVTKSHHIYFRWKSNLHQNPLIYRLHLSARKLIILCEDFKRTWPRDFLLIQLKIKLSHSSTECIYKLSFFVTPILSLKLLLIVPGVFFFPD